MNDYEIALIIWVRQRGVDLPDAVNRVTDNLALYEGHEFTSSFSDEAGVTRLMRRPHVVMGAKSGEST